MSGLGDALDKLEQSFLRKKIIKQDTISSSLNEILKVDNLRGLSVEISGVEGSGKTKKIYELITELQKQNQVCILINADFSFDTYFAAECGINNDLLYLFDNNNINQIVEILGALKDCFIFIDSIAGIEMSNAGIRALFGIIKKNHLGLIYTNQLRLKRKGVSSYGSKYLKFYTNRRLLLAKDGIQVKK